MSLSVISFAGCPPAVMSSAVISSGPGAFFFGISWIILWILSVSGGGPCVYTYSRFGGSGD